MTTGIPKSLAALTARIPRLLRFLGLHLLAGAAIGMAFATVLATSRSLGLRELIGGAEQPWIALVMLYVMNVLTFGSLAMGIGVMTLPMDEPCDMREPGKRDGD